MQSPITSIETIKELQSVKLKSAGGRTEPAGTVPSPARQQQDLLDLVLRLQMSLDINWVLGQFMNYLREQIVFDGYAYSLAEPETQIQNGRMAGHSCRYNLDFDDQNLGELVITRGRKFPESELILIENLLATLVYPLRNAIQHKVATQSAFLDALTGVNNRATFDAALQREMELAHRGQTSFAILVIDIDHFKQVNDNYGHRTGDEVLKQVANCIQASIRGTDQLFRYGGEEFVVLLDHSGCDAAKVSGQRILDCVRQMHIDAEQEEPVQVTVSMGLTCLRAGDNVSSIFNRADKALYKAKQQGRDRLVCASHEKQKG